MESQKEYDSKELVNTKQKGKRGNPKWQKGMDSPNPLGAGLYKAQLGKLFSDAFLKDKENNKEDLFELAFKEARKDNRVLTALLNKFVPDLLKGEGFDSKNLTQIFDGFTPRELRELIASIRAGVRESISSKRSI